ncbi:plant UBX domain-containing protein 11 isoform X2 [Iris pallida]|uniref:Plant UBX domain-containing protein 11 isoform X2 n=1 Tax=Iris pallida TaxID=29817 RepID=A0AAX6G9W6_IRIPA|nr:plant UBX domain-containing protein 11 isoform X2 [Iris pallida]
MEGLTYKGSVSDAIGQAQKQKKIFLVHISDEDENSTNLKQSTWADQTVADSISKYCVFLHLVQGSIEALQFSAIYPQKSVPSITAVGYNGAMLWQHGRNTCLTYLQDCQYFGLSTLAVPYVFKFAEGYISAKDFVGAIEKTWASLHFQETAATLLTAALVSTKPEHFSSSSQDVAQVNSSASDVSTSAEENLSSAQIDDNETRPGLETFSQTDQVGGVMMHGEEETISTCKTSEDVMLSVSSNMPTSTSNASHVSTPPKDNLKVDGNHLEASPVSPQRTNISGPGSVQVADTEVEKIKTEEIDGPTGSSNVIKSDDIHLNIRLPNGASLQRKYTRTDTLRSVKDYVDENQISGIVSYDLAVPYPRKVFNEQDMDIALSELGFAARQALIVVPHSHASKPQRGLSSSTNSQNSASEVKLNDDDSGYFGLVRRVFSYVNPFSYLPGNASSSNSEPAPSDTFQQRRSESVLQRPYGLNDQNPSGGGNIGETRRASRPFGSNIHTLRHDEDDFQSGDRNRFWNGNSTQFGGEEDKK